MSSRVLITGAAGFVGHYMIEHCLEAGDEITAISYLDDEDQIPIKGVDLLDADAATAVIEETKPDVIYHLAALASVGRSWEDPRAAIEQNIAMTTNVLEAIRKEAPNASVLIAGSGEIYGIPEQLPVTESAPLRPRNPYAVAKASIDLLGGFYSDVHGIRIARTRSFNHAGPGQLTDYAIASFAKQIAAGEKAGDDPIEIVTGNPDSARDFSDVRDVVAAYRSLATDAEPDAYNVCSGSAVSIAQIVATFGELAETAVKHTVNPELVRPHDVPEIRGSNEKLKAATNWEPQFELRQTLADTLEYFRAAAD